MSDENDSDEPEQLELEITNTSSPIQSKSVDPIHNFAKWQTRYARRFHKSIRDAGYRIFNVKSENDFDSVETDYGAPAQGLNFFPQLLDAIRSYRYEPLHKTEGSYHTHIRQVKAIGRAMKRQGFKVFESLKEYQFPSQIHFTNGGVTRGFADTIDLLIEEYNKLQSIKKQFGSSHRGGIIVPVPTYGLFLSQLEDALTGHDIDIIKVKRRENGSVEPLSLERALRESRETNTHILGYYDCNPHNPTGYIRQKTETEEIAAVLMAESEHYLAKEEPVFAAAKNIIWASALDKPFGGIVIIDDMAYEDLEHIKNKKPFSFGQVSRDVAEKTVVLKGLSKIGLPGVRTGLMVAGLDIVEPLAERQLMREFAASSIGVDILAARYGGSSAHRRAFNKHFENLRREHVHKAGIMEAFFNGTDHAQKLTSQQKKQLVVDYAEYKGISSDQARKVLSGGLAPFQLADGMDCGFFQRVYCEALRDKPIYMKFDDTLCASGHNIQKSWQLYWVFRSFGMRVVAASQAGCPERDLTVRMTLSLPQTDLFRLYDSMQAMRTYFFGEKPSVQLDLFRLRGQAVNFAP